MHAHHDPCARFKETGWGLHPRQGGQLGGCCSAQVKDDVLGLQGECIHGVRFEGVFRVRSVGCAAASDLGNEGESSVKRTHGAGLSS